MCIVENVYWETIKLFEIEIEMDMLDLQNGGNSMMALSNKSFQCPRYWLFVRRIHRSPVNSPLKGPVTRTLMLL